MKKSDEALFEELIEAGALEWRTVTDWYRGHRPSYTWALKNPQLRTELLAIFKLSKMITYGEWFEIFLKMDARPHHSTKEGLALIALKQTRPDLYKELLKKHPNLFRPKNTSYEKWFEIFLKMDTRPHHSAKEGSALRALQRKRPDLYKELLEKNPKLKPKLVAYEKWFEVLLKMDTRPNRATKDGGALNGIQKKRPDLYKELLERNPALRPKGYKE